MNKSIKENSVSGSVSAHSIAAFPNRLGTKRRNKPKTFKDYIINFYKILNNKLHMIPVNAYKLDSKKKKLKIVSSISESFNLDSVLSQLSNFENKNTRDDEDVITYGVEDDKGNLMKVTILNTQANDFETYISAYLSELKNFKDEGVDLKDISLAELLYKLKDLFDVRDVEFPSIPEDIIYNADETSTTVSNDDVDIQDENVPPDEFDLEGESNFEDEFNPEEIGDETEEGEEIIDDESVEDFSEIEDESSTQSILMSIIDMLKSQAEEQKARHEAEAEKARAEQAEYSARAAEATLNNREELIAMQAEKNEQKSKEKEAKKQADLATYRYKKSKGMLDDSNPTFEEFSFDGGILRHILFEEDILMDPALLRRQQQTELVALQAALRNAATNEEKNAIQKQISLLHRKFMIKRQEAKARQDQQNAINKTRDEENIKDKTRQNNNVQQDNRQDSRQNQLSESDIIIETITKDEYEKLDEAVKRQFKRYGNKIVRKFRCYGGPKDGSMVTDAADCGIKKNPLKVRQGKQSARLKKGQRVRKTNMTKRKAPSKRLIRMNKLLRGDTDVSSTSVKSSTGM